MQTCLLQTNSKQIYPWMRRAAAEDAARENQSGIWEGARDARP